MRAGLTRGEDFRDGYEFSPWLANDWAGLGLCELSAGNRAQAEALAQRAPHAITGQPGVSPYYKAASIELDRRLASVDDAGRRASAQGGRRGG